MGKDFSSQRVHGYGCQSTENFGVKLSVQRVFMSTDFSPQSVNGYRCQSIEGS